MRRKYRSQAAIIRDILDAIAREGKIQPSRLACYANLPYDRLQSYLELLCRENYIKREED